MSDLQTQIDSWTDRIKRLIAEVGDKVGLEVALNQESADSESLAFEIPRLCISGSERGIVEGAFVYRKDLIDPGDLDEVLKAYSVIYKVIVAANNALGFPKLRAFEAAIHLTENSQTLVATIDVREFSP